MNQHSDCPAQAQLEELLADKLEQAEEDRVVQHIEDCELCRTRLEQLAPPREDVLPSCVRADDLKHESSAGLEQVLAQLHGDSSFDSSFEGSAVSDTDSLRVLSPSDLPNSLGRLGSYEVTEIVGRGGMGTVFKAVDTTLNRVVAVKILSPVLASHGTSRQRFVREAKSAAAVVHDHVITIHAVDEVDHQPYLVMQFVAGMSLHEKLDGCGHLDIKEILRIGRQIASGLAAAHEQGLVHRDIKPSNILLENGVERVKITDFGLARAVDDASISQSEVIAGTPQYMAPEQASGDAVDHRSDLFSLGSVLYAMCTGRPPFRAKSTLATLRAVADHQPRPIREINEDIPEWLVDIINRLHEKNPDQRFQSAGEVERALAERLAGLQQPTVQGNSTGGVTGIATEAIIDHPSRTSRTRLRTAVAVGLCLLLGLTVTELAGGTNIRQVLSTVFRIETPAGTVVIEVDDPSATVTLDGEEISIGADGFKELRLKPGSYEFGAKREGVSGERRRVVVTRGSKELVKISLEKKPAKAEQETQKPATFEERQKTQELVEILQQRVKVLKEQYRVGKVTEDHVVRASIGVLEAELQLATSAADRITNLEQQLVKFRNLESALMQQYKVGKRPFEDVLAVQAERVRAEKRLNEERRNSTDVRAQPAEMQVLGMVEFDERNIVNVHTRVAGRIERMFVDHNGVQVKKGDKLCVIHSPELYAAQVEFLQSIKHKKKLPAGAVPRVDLVATARQRLSLMGLTKEQIDALEKEDKATGLLTLHSPASGVIIDRHGEQGAVVTGNKRLIKIGDPTRLWVKLDVYRSLLRWVSFGQRITLTTDALPAMKFVSKIAFIEPIVDPKTGAVKIRVDLKHPEQKLKPGMFIRGVVAMDEK